MYQLILTNYDNKDKPTSYIIHDSRHSILRLLNPVLDLEVNKTGTLRFTIAPNHPHFDKLEKLKSEISVYRDGEWLFTGRILNEEVDIYNQRKIECEGILAYLLDTMQYASNYEFYSLYEYLSWVLDVHNTSLSDFNIMHKQIGLLEEDIDDTTFDNPIIIPTDYSDTLTNINNTLNNYFGKGYLSICYKEFDGRWTRFLQYIKNPSQNNNQIIKFGSNLLDMISYDKGEEIFTGIIPLGKVIDEEHGTRLSLVEMTDSVVNNNSTYNSKGIKKRSEVLYKPSAVAKYGYIVKPVILDECENKEDLLRASLEYLEYYTTDTSSIEVSAFDLNLLNPDIQPLSVAQTITVLSEPHNMNIDMIVEKMSIDIASPEKSKITLITAGKRTLSNNTITNKTTNTESIITGGNTYHNYSYGGGYYNNVSSNTDLSGYATKREVNDAFNNLARLLGGL